MSDIGLMIESFPSVLWAGLVTTIPMTILSFILALIIAVIVALIQYAKVPVLTQLSRFLYLDYSWYTIISTIICGVLWFTIHWLSHKSLYFSSCCYGNK